LSKIPKPHYYCTASSSLGHSKKGWTNGEYTHTFLSYARKNRIHVLCYPAHATHVYQGLDVAVKTYWSQERNDHERKTGGTVDKTNFLAIYGRAHVQALSTETIKSAFRKTGAWPFDPGATMPDQMTPSMETNLIHNAAANCPA
jgi:hypothetical protein